MNNNNKGGASKKKSSTKKKNTNTNTNKEFKTINYKDNELKFINEEFPKICNPYTYTPAIIEARDRIVVFGDIHGDLKLAISMLTQSGVALYDQSTGNIKWIGGTTCVVQVGDQIDRCRPMPNMPCNHPKATYNDEANDIKIMELFNSLSLQAKKVGGLVISLLGNHELLNAQSRMDYVSYKGLRQFEDYVDPDSPDKVFDSGLEARIHAFKPGNIYGKMLGCTRHPAVIVGSNMFVHAGIIDALVEEINLRGLDDFERINIKIKRWLIGLLDQDYVEHIIKYSENSMFWSRVLGKIPPGTSLTSPVCMDNIKNVLNLFSIGSIIIGHTPQSFQYSNDINSTCGEKVWRVDNGSSSAFNSFDSNFIKNGNYSKSRRMQYLEIINDSNYFVCDETGCKKEMNTL